MAYSKIVSVEVTNFMVYKHAKITFDDSNIINLKGYNSSGKSSMLKAIAVCMMNMFPTKQTKLIRHGEDYFRIVMTFDDGVAIVRDKYINGQSLYEMYKNNKLIFTTKEGRKFGNVKDVPKVIQDYLGLCTTSYGCLNYQSRDDVLWLVQTKGSENYQSLNEILKTEEIARANTLLNSDKNQVGSDVAQVDASLNETKSRLLDLSNLTDDLLGALEDREVVATELTGSWNAVQSIESDLRESTVKIQPKVEGVDTTQLNEVQGIYDSLTELNESERKTVGKPVEKITSITRDKDVSNVFETLKELSEMQTKTIPDVGSEIKIDNRNDDMKKIEKLMQEYAETIKEDRTIVKKINTAVAKLDNVVAEAKAQGIHFVQCQNCGSYVEVTQADLN